MLERLLESRNGKDIHQLMLKNGIAGVPNTYTAAVQEQLIRNTLLGRFDGDKLVSAYIIVPDTNGMSYMQALADGPRDHEEIREAVTDAFEMQPSLQAVWTQESAAKVPEMLRAGFVPCSPLNFAAPCLCLTRFSLGL